MGVPTSKTRFLVTGLLVVAAVCLALSGCSDETGEPTTTAVSMTDSSSIPETTISSTTDTTKSLMTEWDLQLEETANAQHLLALRLDETGAPDNDSQRALLYGLRARVNALTCLNALDRWLLVTDESEKAQLLEVADIGMREVYSALNRGRAIAAGSTEQTLADAHAIVETLGAPSDRPEEAKTILEEFVEAVAPFVDEAIHLATAPTTTLSTTTLP